MIILNALLAAVIGAFVGKFMAMTVHFLPQILLEGCDKGREPNDIFTWYFRKPFCWHCQHPLAWSEHIPIIGYLLQQGRCSHCQKPLELKIIVLEIGIALLFGISTLFFPIDFSLLFVLCASCLLICCFITDYEYGILPDQITLTLVWLGLIASLRPVFISSQEAIIGAVCGYGIFWLLNLIYRYFRKFEGMFPGDFKLNAGIGACVGIKLLLPILLISFVLMLVVTLIKVFYTQKVTDTGHLVTSYLYKEIAYACFTTIVAFIALFLLLSKVISPMPI